MPIIQTRRSLLTGLGAALIAAPAVARADSLMPVRSIDRLLMPSFLERASGEWCILHGKTLAPVTMMEWARWFGTADRRVAADEIAGVRISTVCLGMNHQISPDRPALYFETMIFGGEHDGYTDRYSTWQEAERGHAKARGLVLPVLPLNT
jgi:hypothetical protein